MRTSSSREVHLRSARNVRERLERGVGVEDRSRPGPFGFLCTGGLALDTMTGGRAMEGIVIRKGEVGCGDIVKMNEVKGVYIRNRKRRQVISRIIYFPNFGKSNFYVTLTDLL